MLHYTSDKEYKSEFAGKIVKISGNVIDVQFPQGKTPNINSELFVELPESQDHKESHAVRYNNKYCYLLLVGNLEV